MPSLNSGALLRCTRAPCVSGLTDVKHANMLGAITSNFRPKDRITGVSIVNCSLPGICRKHKMLRTTDVNMSLRSKSVTVHYGVIYIRKRALGGRSTKRVSARRTSRLVHFLSRGLNSSHVRFCAKIRCHRLLIVGKKSGHLTYIPPRSVPLRPFHPGLIGTLYPRTRRATSLLGTLVLGSRRLLTARPIGLGQITRKGSPTGDV